jgi:hypothetical protein
MTDGTIITSVKDAIAVGSTIIESAENEVAWLIPRPTLVYASQYGVIEKITMLIQKGILILCISDISYHYIDCARELLNIGEDVRHSDRYHGIFMMVRDNKESLSSMSSDATNLLIDDSVVALWSNDSTYAEYLMSTFGMAWQQAIPAAQRIEELLREGPPQV